MDIERAIAEIVAGASAERVARAREAFCEHAKNVMQPAARARVEGGIDYASGPDETAYVEVDAERLEALGLPVPPPACECACLSCRLSREDDPDAKHCGGGVREHFTRCLLAKPAALDESKHARFTDETSDDAIGRRDAACSCECESCAYGDHCARGRHVSRGDCMRGLAPL